MIDSAETAEKARRVGHSRSSRLFQSRQFCFWDVSYLKPSTDSKV